MQEELASLKYLDNEEVKQATMMSDEGLDSEENLAVIRIEDQNPTP
jgi:hypothetical protein